MARRSRQHEGQLDLFALHPDDQLIQRLDGVEWPDGDRFPVNRASESVRSYVWQDLLESPRPLVVAGYSSIGQVIDFVADWQVRGHEGDVRLLLGSEPFGSQRISFTSSAASFSASVREYWYSQGISLYLSAKIVTALEALDAGRLEVRFVHGRNPLHAKVYVGQEAASTGSSNFTVAGLTQQIEVNARFVRSEEATRYEELAAVGRNLWGLGTDWRDEFRRLLEDLLQVVTWQEALSRACVELLEGEWARDHLLRSKGGDDALWPSQRAGIAQAMWIIENVGSVLVADATGSGKTKMGAHLVRAVRDRLWETGRARRDLTVLVCPPSVEEVWRREAIACGLSLNTVSHGRLSRRVVDGPRLDRSSVQNAQLLAVDEAHNFLNATANRTRSLRRNLADHILLFTATPISRGARDLLDLVALLGPDNFDDRTHKILRKLERGRRSTTLDEGHAQQLRDEIQRFTLRRTKSQINAMVEEEPDAYRHPVTGRVCRYPEHRPSAYATGESPGDAAAATHIRELAGSLAGITLLPADLAVPTSMRSWFTDEQWLTFRMRSAAGLAAHHVMAALRSSRAALHEHLFGTSDATSAFGLDPNFKSDHTGDVVSRTEQVRASGRPASLPECDVPDWLAEDDRWDAACQREAATYREIGALLREISSARETRKADLLARLVAEHLKVLAFDGHLITLALLAQMIEAPDAEVLIATGQSNADRRRIQRTFAPDATDSDRVIALCSDAMNEGLNLQRASAIAHLDLPTTLRIAEQRVGRVDRMDAPHDEIEAWWPRDGEAFATRARERLVRRLDESRILLGANLPVPDLRPEDVVEAADEIVELEDVQKELDEAIEQRTDHLADALEPVRSLVDGPEALVQRSDYRRQRGQPHRVLARVAPVDSATPWAFFAVRSSVHGAPRWMFTSPEARSTCLTDLSEVAARLREHLADDPPSRILSEDAAGWLTRCLDVASSSELELLPRKFQRALDQMREVTASWAALDRTAGDERRGQRWQRLSSLTEPTLDEGAPDLAAVAEKWLDVTAERMESFRREHPRRRYVLIGDITGRLRSEPLLLEQVEAAMSDVPTARPFADRVAACILGVPEGAR